MKYKRHGKKKFKQGYKANQDFYGRECFDYAKRWAELLETDIHDNKKKYDSIVELFFEFANQRSHDADTRGITGFMYGCAVQILSETWKYGTELALWHNAKYSYDGDGVVNPAILTIG